MSQMPRWAPVFILSLCLLWAPRARADVDVRALWHALQRNHGASLQLPSSFETEGRLRLLVELDTGATPNAPAGPALSNTRFRTLSLAPDELWVLDDHPGARFYWSPPRRLLLNQANEWTRAAEYRRRTKRTGRGVAIGIIDSGLDISHPDLRNADGTTRVARLLDFSRRPMGLQPELEEKYRCVENQRCAVLTGEDLDVLLNNDTPGDEPTDDFGHGTHVAALAAGNGRADPTYTGLAPEASLIIVRATRAGTGVVFDEDVVDAASFVFSEAEELGMPAVLNLSLGSDIGPHDGTSTLERALAALVGDEFPGRAIVVAAGNSGGLFHAADNVFPNPLGVHTEVHVPLDTSVRVPLLTPPTVSGTTHATIFVWAQFLEGESAAVGLDRAGGPWVRPVAPGTAAAFEQDGLQATIFNQIVTPEGEAQGLGPKSAMLVLQGQWPAGETFALRFEGQATARLWLQSEGQLSPAAGSVGALFPAAFKAGTINIPATHPELIAVGATINRVTWPTHQDSIAVVEEHGVLSPVLADSMALFSSAGPNSDGYIKPDIVAPGAYVISAMAQRADPRDGDSSLFASEQLCAEAGQSCLVVDDAHAVAQGTSMAAPVVAGSVALLLEEEPDLTQGRVRALLQAGSRPLEGAPPVEQQVGVGALDLEATLEVQRTLRSNTARNAMPSSQHTRLVLGAPLVRPSSTAPLRGMLLLRNELDRVADGVDVSGLVLTVEPGEIVEKPTRQAPGLWSFGVVAPAGSGGSEMRIQVRFNGELLAERHVPISVDHAIAERGSYVHGGCQFSSSVSISRDAWWLALAMLLGGARRRRRTGPAAQPTAADGLAFRGG